MTEALLGFLLPGLLVAQAALPPATVAPGDRVVVTVTDDQQTIRGRINAVTPDSLVLDDDGARVRLPIAAVHQVDRVGDSLWNGTAIGAALGGGSAIAAMARTCSNTNCADTSANLDPRLTLLGTLVGAGIGALIDAGIDRRETVYRTGSGQTLALPSAQSIARKHGMAFARIGRAGFSDDEGSLGGGTTVGVGVVVPLGRRFGLQIAYDRQKHKRVFGGGAPPEIAPSGGRFVGTEQLVTAKALIFFRADKAIQPYAGIGAGLLDSKRASTFSTYFMGPGGIVAAGPFEVFRYHSSEVSLGFAAGFDARVTHGFSILTDLTLDLSRPSAFSSTRLTVGAGFHF
jgi:hypothetical protein